MASISKLISDPRSQAHSPGPIRLVSHSENICNGQAGSRRCRAVELAASVPCLGTRRGPWDAAGPAEGAEGAVGARARLAPPAGLPPPQGSAVLLISSLGGSVT